nr:MAG TPA: hypothetical protein [Caudoviricetes sp.]
MFHYTYHNNSPLIILLVLTETVPDNTYNTMEQFLLFLNDLL